MDRLIEATARAEREHFWFHGLHAFVRPLMDAATADRPSVRLLDCGCGTGHNLATLLRPYGRSVGVDLTWSGLAYARESGVTGVARADAAQLPFGDGRFDVVTSFDMLQCVPDAEEAPAIAEMYRVLRPGGHAIVNVSAFDALFGDHSILTHEIRRYTRARLRRKLERAGFTIVRLTYTNASLVPILLVTRFWQRRRGLVASDQDETATREITVPPGPINALMRAVVGVEARAARAVALPFGSSLLCLARKP
jgi:SAM-dependent methyltransferase